MEQVKRRRKPLEIEGPRVESSHSDMGRPQFYPITECAVGSRFFVPKKPCEEKPDEGVVVRSAVRKTALRYGIKIRTQIGEKDGVRGIWVIRTA